MPEPDWLQTARARGLVVREGPRAAVPIPAPDPSVSEDVFLGLVLQLARAHGWRTFHPRPARTKAGTFVTAVQGDGVGYPDLTCVHREWRRVVWIELKADGGRVRPAQREWIDALRDAGQEVHVLRPADWPVIVRVLTGGDDRA